MYHNKYKVPYTKSLQIDDIEPAKMRPISLEEKAEAKGVYWVISDI